MIKAQNVCFDLETTSKYASKADIVEIAAIAFNYDCRTRNKADIIACFHSLVKPPWNDPSAVKIHGITDAMLHESKSIECVFPLFMDWVDEHAIKDFVWVGHNIRRYDLPILKRHCKHNSKLERDVFDTLEIARKVYKGQKRKTLTSLYAMLNGDVSDITAHRAMGDVKMNIVLACDELKQLNLLAIA